MVFIVESRSHNISPSAGTGASVGARLSATTATQIPVPVPVPVVPVLSTSFDRGHMSQGLTCSWQERPAPRAAPLPPTRLSLACWRAPNLSSDDCQQRSATQRDGLMCVVGCLCLPLAPCSQRWPGRDSALREASHSDSPLAFTASSACDPWRLAPRPCGLGPFQPIAAAASAPRRTAATALPTALRPRQAGGRSPAEG